MKEIYVIKTGSMECLKWIALLSMTLDHVNKFLLNGTIECLFNIGRLALPIFIFVFSYNLSRSSYIFKSRLGIRLLIFGGLSSIPFTILNNDIAPLNILFSFFVVFLICKNLESENYLKSCFLILLIVYSNDLIEYGYISVFMGISSYLYFKKMKFLYLAISFFMCGLLVNVNNNIYALFSIPIIMLTTQINIKIIRIKRFFYYYYVFHLSVILIIRKLLEKEGYLFF